MPPSPSSSPSPSPPVPDLDTALRMGLVVNLALMFGLLTFFVLTLTLAAKPVRADPWSVTEPLTVLGLGMAGVVLLGLPLLQDVVIAGPMASLAREPNLTDDDRDGRLIGLYQTRGIVGSALLEGPAFFNLLMYWHQGTRVSLVAAAVLMVMLLIRIPRRDAAVTWLDNRRQRLDEMRQLPG